MITRRRTLILLTLAVLFGGSVFFSPHWHVHQMVTAAEGRDAEKFSRYVDYPALRDSLKAQFAQSVDQQMGGDDSLFGAIGKMIGRAIAEPVIEATVSPAGAMAMVVETPPSDLSASATSVPPAQAKADYAVSYRGWDSVDASTTRANGDTFTMRLRRAGLWSWQWVGVVQASAD